MRLTAKRSQNGFTIIEGIVATTLVVALFAGTANVLVSMAKQYASTYISDMGETEAEVFRTAFDYAVKNCQQFQIHLSTDSFNGAEAPQSAGNLLVCNMGKDATLTKSKYLIFWYQPDSPGSATGKLCYGETDTAGSPSLPGVYATFHDALFSPYEAAVPANLFSMEVDPTTNKPIGLVQFSYSVNYEREAVSYNGISYPLSMR